jgi:hypothetical protein
MIPSHEPLTFLCAIAGRRITTKYDATWSGICPCSKTEDNEQEYSSPCHFDLAEFAIISNRSEQVNSAVTIQGRIWGISCSTFDYGTASLGEVCAASLVSFQIYSVMSLERPSMRHNLPVDT